MSLRDIELKEEYRSDRDDIVAEFNQEGVGLVRAEERKGKEYAQLLAIREAKGDILIFSDVATGIDKGALKLIAQRFADTATPEPELEPHGLRSSTYGFLVCPPTPLQPLDEKSARKFAHSLRFDFAIMMAPASLNFFATQLSSSG